MTDCFISYSSTDEPIARRVRAMLVNQGVSVFMAAISLNPGDRWSEEIKRELLGSVLVIFLASAKAASSAYVQQELGIAMAAGKKIIPITWEMSPSDLPGWMKEIQALDLRGATIEDAERQIANIGKGMQQEKLLKLCLLVLAIVIVAILTFYALEHIESHTASDEPGA